MNDNISYNVTDTSKISLGNMNFNIINLQPKYNKSNSEDIKNEIETKLFNIFSKYASKY